MPWLEGGGRQVAYSCTEKVSPGQDVVCYPNRPLNTNTVRRLRQLAAQGEFRRFGNQLEVELNMPFAPAIVGSVVLTVILSGSVIQWMSFLVQRLQQWLV